MERGGRRVIFYQKMKLPKSARMNYEDYCRLPNNGRRYEIIDGELHNHPAPVISHQRIVGRLFNSLFQYVTTNNLGEVFVSPIDILFSNEDIVQPDIVYISKENEKIITEKNIQGIPDLIIEIISTGTEDYDSITKKRLYAKYKVKEYWVVDPFKKQIEVFIFKNKRYNLLGKFKKNDNLKSQIIKELVINLKEVF